MIGNEQLFMLLHASFAVQVTVVTPGLKNEPELTGPVVAPEASPGVATRTVAASHDSLVSTTICGQRTYSVRVSRLRGAGAFTLTVTKP